jgi:hypothetical protein
MRHAAAAEGGAMRKWLIGLAVSGAAGLGPAEAQEDCGTYPLPQETYTCTCPAAGAPGAVWGSGPYTADSDICTAALHAGVIGQQGGSVTAILRPGEASYAESTANGVTTQRWGSYDSSYDFPADIGLQAVDTPVPGPTAPGLVPVASGEDQLCAGLDYASAETVCRCDPGQGTGATVWGSSPYVAGSDLCAAARHAEVIGLDGGVISVIRVPGLTSYRGSERGGIKTDDWGEYNDSFIVNAN